MAGLEGEMILDCWGDKRHWRSLQLFS